MNKSSLFLWVLLLSSMVSNICYAQLSPKEVDALVEKAMQKFEVAGAAVAIVKDGKVIYKKGFGVKSIDTKLPVDEHTNFGIGSNTKAFTTAALSILVDEGKVSWKDKVKMYIPEFKMYNEYVTENFTVEDLLTHRSGLGLGAGDLMLFPDSTNFTIHDILTNFQYFKPVSAFRTQFDYDNQLYIVAGELIARVSGMSYEAFIQNRIMLPLGMDYSYAALGAMKDRGNLAAPHSTVGGKMKRIGLFGDMVNNAAGGLLCNVDDMAKWMLMQLNHGKYGSNLEKQLFSAERQSEMWRIHTVEEANTSPRYHYHVRGYGLGWELADVRGNLSVSHTGGLPGMLSMVTMMPDLNLGIVILTNTENGGAGLFSAVSQTILDGYLGLEDFAWVDKYAAYFEMQKSEGDSVVNRVWETVKAANGASVKQGDYIGLYKDNWFGEAEVFVKEGNLWFRSARSPKLIGQMFFYKANAFAIKWLYQDMNCDAFAIFSLDEEGKAEGIRMKGISPNIDFSFDFQDLEFRRIK